LAGLHRLADRLGLRQFVATDEWAPCCSQQSTLVETHAVRASLRVYCICRSRSRIRAPRSGSVRSTVSTFTSIRWIKTSAAEESAFSTAGIHASTGETSYSLASY